LARPSGLDPPNLGDLFCLHSSKSMRQSLQLKII
jgi:hypothetical protein